MAYCISKCIEIFLVTLFKLVSNLIALLSETMISGMWILCYLLGLAGGLARGQFQN